MPALSAPGPAPELRVLRYNWKFLLAVQANMVFDTSPVRPPLLCPAGCMGLVFSGLARGNDRLGRGGPAGVITWGRYFSGDEVSVLILFGHIDLLKAVGFRP